MSLLPKFLRTVEAKKKEFSAKAFEFSLDNRGSFVLLADPDTDVIFMAYRGFVSTARFIQPDGKRMRIVSDAVHYRKGAKGEKSVDQFLLAVDSGLVNISEALYSAKRKSFIGKTLELVGMSKDIRPLNVPQEGAIESPFQMKNAEEESL